MAEPRRSWGARLARPVIIIPLILAIVLTVAFARHAGTGLVVSRPVAEPDAIVTLASHEWERLPLTARRATQNPKAIVLLTLPQQLNQFNCHDCSHRVQILAHAGVQPSRMRIVPLTSSGTHGEALATLSFSRRVGTRRLLIVTSPYHTRRALATFRAVFAGTGVEIGIEPATLTSPARPASWWRTPYDRWYVRYEWAAIVYYWVRYGVDLFG